jgi:hypothetical protein
MERLKRSAILPDMRSASQLLGVLIITTCGVVAHAAEYFEIQVVDSQTGRGVPLVCLETTDKARYYTDSGGYIAFDEPGLMNERVWFTITSHGYEFSQESFGTRGTALDVKPGGKARLEIKRLNIAERFYRVTGQGIYRDTVLLGHQPPIEQPLLNGKVMGQDSVFNVIYRGELYWFWGDTNRPGHFLGNFFMSGATSELPENGGLDPSRGVNLAYFVDPETGFAKHMAQIDRSGPYPLWLDGILVIEDPSGRERMFAHYSRVKDMSPIERGLMLYNDEVQRFEAIEQIPLETKVSPGGHPLRVTVDGEDYFYFSVPYPTVRVKARWEDVLSIGAYEGFTCFTDGSAYNKQNPPLDRNGDGKLVWKWRRGTAAPTPTQLKEMIDAGFIKTDETPLRLQNVDDGQPLLLHGASVYWNEYRNKWVMIGLQIFGDSILGEVFFAEADRPEGPWIHAKKVATHAMKNNNQDFYNPRWHPYFSQDGGRIVYFEGTYVNTFSGNPQATPRYDYNQLMYRLDLADPRLKFP